MSIRKGWNKLRYYLSFLLFAFYLAVGGTFLFTETWADLVPKHRITIGIILVLFGLLRFYIAYRRYINKSARLHPAEPKPEENAAAES